MAPKTRIPREAKGKAPQTSTPPPPSLPFASMKGVTREEKQNFAKIKSKLILPNKIPSLNALRTLGIDANIQAYLGNLSWGKFIFVEEDGYDDLTREFLATIEVERKVSSPLGVYGIRFRFLGQPYGITLDELASIFGLPNEGAWNLTDLNMSFNEFWREISIETRYDPKSSLSKHFRTLTFWVLHRIVTFSINARGDGNEKVSQKDLFFLFGLLKNQQINTPKFLVDQFLHLAKTPKGTILLSSQISMIAKYVGALTPQLKPLFPTKYPSNFNFLDIDYLLNSRCIQDKNGTFEYALGEKGIQVGDTKRTQKRQRLIIEEEPQEAQAQTQEGRSQKTQSTQTSPPFSHPPSNIERMFSKIMKRLSLLDHLHGDITELQTKMGIEPCHLPDWEASEEEEDEN